LRAADVGKNAPLQSSPAAASGPSTLVQTAAGWLEPEPERPALALRSHGGL